MTTACSSPCTGRRKRVRCQRQLLSVASILAGAYPASGFILPTGTPRHHNHERRLSLPTPRHHNHERRNRNGRLPLLAESDSPLAVVEANLINAESPTILTIDNLLSEDDMKAAMECVETECVSTATTSDYQEDIFRDGAEEEEDRHFADAVERALGNGVDTQQNIPEEHANSPLEQFLWVVTNYPSAMDQGDIVTGANFIQRRQARQKWESEGGRQLLQLSMDEQPFTKAGKRYEMPIQVRDMLLEKTLRRIMLNPQT